MKNFTQFCSLFSKYKIVKSDDKVFPRGMTEDYYGNGDVMSQEDVKKNNDIFIDNIDNSLITCKIFNVSDNIKKLLSLTNVPSKNDLVRLPFPSIFIDVNFVRDDMLKLGIDIGYDKIIGVLFSEGTMITEDSKCQVGKALRMTILSIHGSEVWFDTFNSSINIDDKYAKFDFKVVKCDVTNPHARKFIHLFVLAFLNFINNPEVEIVRISRCEVQNAKRISKGKYPIPSMYAINLDGVLKKYVDSLESSGHFEYHYRFWCRGHFRILRDERKWGKNVGKKIWIAPYVKGKGVLIEKHYEVKGE